MSNNPSQPDSSALPFLAVEYDKRKAVVSRNTNYQETLIPIKQVFRSLRNALSEDIGLNAHLEELDDSFRVAQDLWPELMPRLSMVKVTLDAPAQLNLPEEQPTESAKLEEQEEMAGKCNAKIWQ